MVKYAGELLRVEVTAQDFDTTDPIVPAEIDRVTIEIRDSQNNLVVDETVMTYDTEEEIWIYLWDTIDTTLPTPAPLAAGSYFAKCRIYDLDDHVSIEFVKERLKAQRF